MVSEHILRLECGDGEYRLLRVNVPDELWHLPAEQVAGRKVVVLERRDER